MLFRYLSPDCQALVHKKTISELPYYGVYLSIKATDLNIGELSRLQNQVSGHILNEHFLIVYLTVKILSSLQKDLEVQLHCDLLAEMKGLCLDGLIGRLRQLGWSGKVELDSCQSVSELIESTIEIFDEIHGQSFQYLKHLFEGRARSPFKGVLLGFQDFLLPLLQRLRKLSFTPDGPVYLFIDDADNLTFEQTQVLNTWVSYRTTDIVSLKIATQLGYKTFSTVNARRIEEAHDYSEVVISNIYTGGTKDNYPSWVEKVVLRRLEIAGMKTDAKAFFPEDVKQKKEIEKIANELKAEWEINGTSYRPSDDAYRFARPEYIRRLGGSRKQTHTYSYAGFEQLVHVSSGIIRYFLDSAADMYSYIVDSGTTKPKKIASIPPKVQNMVLRDEADELMHSEFDNLVDDILNDQIRDNKQDRVQRIKKLQNLIMALGSVFYQYLIDQSRTERRYFSFFVSSEPSDDVKEILRLGIEFGYFYKSYVGTREGRGRTPLYVMTRRLALLQVGSYGLRGLQICYERIFTNGYRKSKGDNQ